VTAASFEPAPDDPAIWDAYNLLLAGPDTERLRKLLLRYDHFCRTVELPGDIVEAGVLKGTGLLFWAKLLQIRCPGTLKRVVGFDLFGGFERAAAPADRGAVRALLDEAGGEETTPGELLEKVRAAGLPAERCELVAGDIRETAARYLQERPGFRISLMNLDLDLGAPTRAALELLWPRVVRGGVVLLDEYAIGRWSASEGIDAWLRGNDLRLHSIPWGRSPTAYLIKP